MTTAKSQKQTPVKVKRAIPKREPITNFPEKEKRIYLSNKDLLNEIQNVKMTFCWILDEKYTKPHMYIRQDDDIDFVDSNPDAHAKFTEALLLAQISNPEIKLEDVVIRRMSYSHIPKDPTRKKRINSVSSEYMRISFPAFRQYALIDNKITEVVRSHWEGDLETGHFSASKGKISEKLSSMWMLLIERFSSKARYRLYSYNEEMRGESILHMLQVGLQFDESKSQSPFSFYTTTITNCFVAVKSSERALQDARDDLLIANGAQPSFTRQVDHEHAIKQKNFNNEFLPDAAINNIDDDDYLDNIQEITADELNAIIQKATIADLFDNSISAEADFFTFE